MTLDIIAMPSPTAEPLPPGSEMEPTMAALIAAAVFAAVAAAAALLLIRRARRKKSEPGSNAAKE